MKVTKQDLIDNLDEYTPEDIAGCIRDEVVTFSDLCDEAGGDFSHRCRKEVKEHLATYAIQELRSLESNPTKEGVNHFLKVYSEHVEPEILDKVNAIGEQIQREEQDKDILEEYRQIDSNDVHSLTEFAEKHAGTPWADKARNRIKEIKKTRIYGSQEAILVQSIKNESETNKIVSIIRDYLYSDNNNRSKLLEIIRRDKNLLHSRVINQLVDIQLIEYEDLFTIGIDERFVKALIRDKENRRDDLSYSSKAEIKPITAPGLEVYFWGIPTSGKTTAIAALLSVVRKGIGAAKSVTFDNNSQGYGYYNQLSQLFRQESEVASLPPGTSVEATYAGGLTLEDKKGKDHKYTFVDLSGEILRSMYKSDAKEQLMEDELKALNKLNTVLGSSSSRNKKIHFIVLEYTEEERVIEGLDNDTYLSAALRYIESKGIFKHKTDAIFLMLAKIDRMPDFKNLSNMQLRVNMKRYLDTRYKGFYQGLQRICRKNWINGRSLEIIPFSLGEVCFKNYCLFDPKLAKEVVERIMDRPHSILKTYFSFLSFLWEK